MKRQPQDARFKGDILCASFPNSSRAGSRKQEADQGLDVDPKALTMLGTSKEDVAWSRDTRIQCLADRPRALTSDSVLSAWESKLRF